LPITGAGLTIAAFWLFEEAIWGTMEHPLAAYAMMCACSLLMVSRIEYEKFPELGRHDKRNRTKWWIAAAAILIIGIKPALAGLSIALLYLCHGPVLALFHTVLAGTGNRQGSNGS